MQTHRKATHRAANCIFGWLPCILIAGLSHSLAQSSSQDTSTPPPSLTAGVFPLDQVHRGLHGVAYTVFEGVKPEPMGVDILGVLPNALGPGQDLILARLAGPKPEYTGVVAGMSGSPVYIDGKLLGALSYRIGQFSKEPIAGITPIAQMFQVRDQSPTAPNPAPAPANVSTTPAAANPTIQSIETPLVFSGFGPEAIKLWQDHLPGSSLTATAGLGGGSTKVSQPEPIVPGSAVSAILVRGDLEISATCTVTYVDPKQLLACGHPITQFGPVDMPMTKAEVVATLPSPLNAFKIVNTADTVGAFNQDRQSAIGGLFGTKAHMLPVSVQVRSPQESRARNLHFEVIDQPQITPVAVMVSIFQSLLANNAYAAETSYRLKGSIALDGYPAVAIDTIVAPTDQLPGSLGTALVVGERFQQLYGNLARTTPIRSVDLEIGAIAGRQSTQIESARTSAIAVHPGENITIETTLQPYRGPARNVRIPVAMPAALPPGPLRLLIGDAASLDRISQGSRAPGHQPDVTASIAQMNSIHSSDRIYVTLLAPDTQAAVAGQTLPSIPLSLANVLEPMRGSQELALNSESAITIASVPVGSMVTGQQVLSLQVE